MGILVCMRVVLSRRCQVSNLPFRFASLPNFLGPALTLPLLLGSGVAVPILRSSMPIFTARACIKTTLDIPGALLREAKVQAAREGRTLRAVVTQALEAALAGANQGGRKPGWQKHFGALRSLRDETAEINAAIADAFETVDDEAWR